MRTAILLLILSATPAAAQSLREMALKHGSIAQIVHACGPNPSLATIAVSADLIVEGTVATRVSYLTPDETTVYTDYTLAINAALFQREMLATTRRGEVIPMMFKAHTGTVTIDGAKIMADVQSNNARVTMKEGDHVYLFATRDAVDGKWLVRAFDVFQVTADRAVLPPDTFSDLPKIIPQAAFVQNVTKALRSR